MNDRRQKILHRLMHNPGMRFNELWNKEGDSNKFAYHLKKLEDDNIVYKRDDFYWLTDEGLKYVNYIDGETGKITNSPLIGVVFVIIDDKDRYLLHQRKKEPFYDYWGFPAGKLKFTQQILECAEEEMMEETGLKCNLELKGLFSAKTFNGKEQLHNHQLFVVKGTNPKGTFIENMREGKNQWVIEKDIDSLETFPDVHQIIDIIRSDRFQWIEAERLQDNNRFKKMRILKNKEF